jgi:ribosomal protein S6--L-glutamate ligase
LMCPGEGSPLFIEINFHFGRKGLGGATGHRLHWRQAVGRWRSRCLSHQQSASWR